MIPLLLLLAVVGLMQAARSFSSTVTPFALYIGCTGGTNSGESTANGSPNAVPEPRTVAIAATAIERTM